MGDRYKQMFSDSDSSDDDNETRSAPPTSAAAPAAAEAAAEVASPLSPPAAAPAAADKPFYAPPLQSNASRAVLQDLGESSSDSDDDVPAPRPKPAAAAAAAGGDSDSSMFGSSDDDDVQEKPRKLLLKKGGAAGGAGKAGKPSAASKLAALAKGDKPPKAKGKKRAREGKEGGIRKKAPQEKSDGGGSSAPSLPRSGAAGGESSDEDSDAEAPRTKDDDDFIVKEGDDEDVLADYAYEGPRAPGSDSEAEEEKPGKQQQQGGTDLDFVLTAMKRVKGQELSVEDRELFAKSFLEKMDEIAMEDQHAVQEGKPALAKIKALKSVEMTLSKQDLWETLLEFDLLMGIKQWLTPYESNGALPSLDVRKSMYRILGALPVTTEFLRRSKLGMTVVTLSKHREETGENRRVLHLLIERWCRPIYNKGTDLRALSRADEMDLAREERRQMVARKKPAAAATESVKDVFQSAAQRAAKVDTSTRVRVPRSHGLAFAHRPQSRVDTEMLPSARSGGAQEPKSTHEQIAKRMLELGKKPSKNVRSVTMANR